jgi:HEAT repeat protein
VGRLGGVAATPEILARLADLLRDQAIGVRRSAAAAVGKLGGAAATSEVLARLADLVHDQDRYVRDAAVSSLRDFTKVGIRLFAGRQGQLFWVRSLARG